MSSKIIIVDDSVTMRLQLRSRLEKEGYEVVEADDGFSGLEIIQEHQDAKVIIADINMPAMDGLTMLETADEKGYCPEGGRVVLTTETSRAMKERGKAVGVAAWFIKPLTPKRFDILLFLVQKIIKGDA